MANSYAAPEVGDPTDWIDGDTIAIGDVITYIPIARLRSLYNFALAHAATGPLVQASWVDGLTWGASPIVDFLTTDPIPILSYAVPVVSTGHLTLRVQARGQRIEEGGGGDPLSVVEVYSPTADASVTLTMDAVTGWHEDTLTIDFGEDRAGERVEVLQVFLYGITDEWRVRLDQLVIDVVEIASPLPAAALDGAAPIGALYATDDAPLSTPTAEALIEGITAMLRRPVVGLAWSAVHEAYAAAFPDLIAAPDGLGVASAAPIVGGHGAVAHLRASDAATAEAISPIRASARGLAAGVYSQHERTAIGGPIAGSSGAVPHGYADPAPGDTFAVGLSIWTRAGLATDVASWAEEV